jgi:hypothetical protein
MHSLSSSPENRMNDDLRLPITRHLIVSPLLRHTLPTPDPGPLRSPDKFIPLLEAMTHDPAPISRTVDDPTMAPYHCIVWTKTKSWNQGNTPIMLMMMMRDDGKQYEPITEESNHRRDTNLLERCRLSALRCHLVQQTLHMSTSTTAKSLSLKTPLLSSGHGVNPSHIRKDERG